MRKKDSFHIFCPLSTHFRLHFCQLLQATGPMLKELWNIKDWFARFIRFIPKVIYRAFCNVCLLPTRVVISPGMGLEQEPRSVQLCGVVYSWLKIKRSRPYAQRHEQNLAVVDQIGSNVLYCASSLVSQVFFYEIWDCVVHFCLLKQSSRCWGGFFFTEQTGRYLTTNATSNPCFMLFFFIQPK